MVSVVLDTNVLVSALFWDGPPAKLVKLLFAQRHRVCSSPELLAEFCNVLQRDFGLAELEAAEESGKLMRFAEIVSPRCKLRVVKNDPDDDKVVECAFECGADYLVSKDKHLLKLGASYGIRIVCPEDLLSILQPQG